MKQIQISQDLFFDLLEYFEPQTGKAPEGWQADEIRKQLNIKLDKMLAHLLYTEYKRAPTAEEREKYRQAYLDHRGIFPDWRSD